MANKYNWVDDPCISGKSPCDTDVLNENLMHIKYDVTDEIQKKADDAINEVVNAVAVQRIYDCGISTDTKGFEIVKELVHSTFDKSKFEVVGSPTITDDGIVNKFTYTNYPSIANNVINKLENNSWKIRFAGISPQSNTILNITGINTQPTGKLNIGWINGTTNFFLQIKNSTTEKAIYVTANKPNTPFVGYAEFDGTNNYTIAISFDGGKTFSKNTMTAEEKVNFEGVNLPIATGSDSVTGSIDLKSIAVWAGGIPVFNGNKTGLYVAKPDNYEVIGSPTITEDGRLSVSEFGQASYANSIRSSNSIDISNLKDFSIFVKLPKRIANAHYRVFRNQVINNTDGTANWNLESRSDIGSSGTGFRFIYYVTTDSGRGLKSLDFQLPEIFQQDVEIGILYEKNSRMLKIIKYIDGIPQEVTSRVVTEDMSYVENCYFYFGMLNNYFLDLNSFRYYMNGNLIYQPCLKIPYTETFEHPNVVDVAYRNRVQDLYEQTGEALFYTIDEQNQNFTLPSGDIYGMITKNREILDIVYPTGRPMPEENNVLLDNEVWLEGATVNPVDYPKLFKVYGTKYGGDGITTFVLPDLRNRVLWGSPDGSNGYIEAQLPNIKGGSVLYSQNADGQLSGCFYSTRSSSNDTTRFPSNGRVYDALAAGINASLYNEIYSDDATTVQPPAFKVRWKTRFE